ncbi:type 2 isopentenyl-diphosphate Delta-isomerase [Limosilactobacillus caccae]|uniref:type 2 isopentenyl-diphosphate Delta-isomerase n=1 Tax=Limosilactobacillus caccae TaxID=1926284 RepID=UPI0009705BD0|nr:type 2 isopentenyl-diphosphate Delta-isomerase [Limosilactobacillus caccae]
MESRHAQRKNEHLSLAAKYYDEAHCNHYFDQVRLIHDSLPEIATDDVDMHVQLADDLEIEQPFYIEAMTGGSEQAYKINQQLARLAKKHHLAMATGSLSIISKDPAAFSSFDVVREENPDGIVFANLSATASSELAREVIDMLHADALELHVNAAQELIMPEGDRDFNWLDNIQSLVSELDVPVIVKEVGFGMSKTTIAKLQTHDVHLINVSGRGGTNFAAIENRRNHDVNFTSLLGWGQTTPESLLEAHAIRRGRTEIIASGGVVSPLDVIKCGVLGARAVGVAGYFLNVLQHDGYDALDRELTEWSTITRRLLALLGCRSFAELSRVEYVLGSELLSYAQQRHLR